MEENLKAQTESCIKIQNQINEMKESVFVIKNKKKQKKDLILSFVGQISIYNFDNGSKTIGIAHKVDFDRCIISFINRGQKFTKLFILSGIILQQPMKFEFKLLNNWGSDNWISIKLGIIEDFIKPNDICL